jgi:MoxR-like ATPase
MTDTDDPAEAAAPASPGRADGAPAPPAARARSGNGRAGAGSAAERAAAAAGDGPPVDETIVRAHAEDQFAAELAALERADDRPRPPSWRLSPWAAVTYVMGGRLDDGTEVTPKYVGQRRLVEIAVATLATDRALLLLGVPGTAKTWLSEHLATAISGRSTLLVQGTSGTPEEAIRYGWNYARLLAEGPTRAALVPSPVMRAMELGALVRIEELTRIPSDVQDALITVLSEKALPIAELDTEVQARKGFNVIATANDRDRGVNDLSAALMRRFNVVVLPLPDDLEDEVAIVRQRVAQLGRALELPVELEELDEIRRVVTIFRELRSGVTTDGRTTLKSPSSTLSTAEAISVVTSGLALAAHFGDGAVGAGDVAAGLVGAVVKDPVQDRIVWQEYLETVVKERRGWSDVYRACRELG